MVVPSMVYHTNREETLAALRAVAEASDLPIMVYSNRLAYRVDVTNDMLLELTEDKRFVAVKESSDDIRRTTEAVGMLQGKMAVFTGVDNYGYEAALVGAAGWIAGLVVAFPKETVAVWKLAKAGRLEEALKIYRWFRPLLDLDVSTYLVQNIKLAEALAIGSNERVRLPRLPLSGDRRKSVEKIVRDAHRDAAGDSGAELAHATARYDTAVGTICAQQLVDLALRDRIDGDRRAAHDARCGSRRAGPAAACAGDRTGRRPGRRGGSPP